MILVACSPSFSLIWQTWGLAELAVSSGWSSECFCPLRISFDWGIARWTKAYKCAYMWYMYILVSRQTSCLVLKTCKEIYFHYVLMLWKYSGVFGRFSLDPLSPQLLRVLSTRVVQEGLKGEGNAIPYFSQEHGTCQDHTPTAAGSSLCLQLPHLCPWFQPAHSEGSPAAALGMLYLRHGKGHLLPVLNSFLFLFLKPECSLFFNQVFSAKCVPDINLHSHQGDTI